MFDFGIGSFELMMLAIVAIIVVGPKDLPKLLRTIGQFTTKIRGMAREFQGYLDEAARETGIDDVKKEVSKMTDFDLQETLDSKPEPKSDAKTDTADPAPKTDFDPVEEGNKAAKATVEAVRAKDAAEAAKAKAVKKTAKKPAKKSAKAKA